MITKKKPRKQPAINLAGKVQNLQKDFVRRLNDTHIFAGQAISLLQDVRDGLTTSTQVRRNKYYVPSSVEGKIKYANRGDEELKEIYDRFISRELYENFIVTAVSQFESFLFDVLSLIITKYPKKLTLNVKGDEVDRNVPLETILNADNKEEAIKIIIEKRLRDISYAPPTVYLKFVKGIAGIDISEPVFLDYFEIKATRDLIVHNSCIVNSLYLEKAGIKKRGDFGTKLNIDEGYFDECIAKLKRLSQLIRRYVK